MMSIVWDSKIPTGVRFKVTKTTKGRLGLIIGEHKFKRSGVQKDGTHIFRCSVKQCLSRVALDPPLRRLMLTSSTHNHPGRNWSDLTAVRPLEGAATPEDGLRVGAGHKTGSRKREEVGPGFLISDAHCTMESSVEHFMEQHMEQHLEHFVENNSTNHVDHFDQSVEHNAQGGAPRCEVTMNNQGGDKLHFNGYSYSKKAISANAIRWTCATPTRSVIRCKGAITTDRERPYCNPRSLALHNHPPEDPEASIMRDIARAKRRLFRRKVYQHPFQFYPWMYPLQQLNAQSGDRERTDGPAFSAGSLEAALGMGGVPRADHLGPGTSGYLDESVKVKMEPEWVDAGALEPNCELEGQFDDPHDFNSEYQVEDVERQRNDQNFSPVYAGHAQQLQQPTMVPNARAPVKLHVPGKPNLTITVASPRPNASAAAAHCPPLNLINPLMSRKRGRPRGSAYGSYNENDDRVTTILTESIIASQKMEKMERAGTVVPPYIPPAAAAMSAPVPGRVKPRSKDPEAVRAAHIVNNAQNRTGSREELEKVCLKLRQEVLALEVQNLKVEREKLAAYRRNIAVRREIMKLHLQLESGIPSECASSGRGLNTVNTFAVAVDSVNHSRKSDNISAKEHPQRFEEFHRSSTSPLQSNQQAKISIRKSLQVPISGSSNSSTATSGVKSSNLSTLETGDTINKESSLTEERREESESWEESETGSQGLDSQEENALLHIEKNELLLTSDETEEPIHSEEHDSGEDDLSMLDSVSPDLSVEFISDPKSRQWTQSANVVEQERFDDQQYGDGSYESSYSSSSLIHNSSQKEPPDEFQGDADESNASKRRRVENMWEPDDNSS